MPASEFRQRKPRIQNKNSMRNMRQYKDMTDDEFEEIYSNVVAGGEKDSVLQEKIDRLTEEFKAEYDLTDLLPNDRAVLKNLIQSMIDLEDYNDRVNLIKKQGISESNMVLIKTLNDICSTLRKNISEMQSDLKITRKVRQSDKDQSVLSTIEDLKLKAKKFYQQKMVWVFCENCNQLLATVWVQYSDHRSAKIKVHCHHKVEDKVCDFEKEYTIKDLVDKGGSNKPELLSDALR